MFFQRKSRPARRAVRAQRRRHEFRVALARQSLKPVFETLESRRVLATITWDGGAGTPLWEDAANWDTNALPGSADDVVIPDLASPGFTFVTLNSAQSIQSLQLAGTDVFTNQSVLLHVEPGSSLTVATNILASEGGLRVLSSNITALAITLNVNASLEGADATLNVPNVTNNGGYLSWGDGGLNLTNPLVIDGNYAQGPFASFAVAVNAVSSSAGRVDVTGAADLDGFFVLTMLNNDPIDVSQSFNVLTFGSASGAFGSLSWNGSQYGGFTLAAPFEITQNAGNIDLTGTVNVVSSNADTGAGSLREAILNANASGDPSLIGFRNIGSIALASSLPAITTPVEINAVEQGGFVGTPIIELDGTAAGATDGLRLAAGSAGSIIRGLVINRFNGNGLSIESSNNRISTNYIGTDVLGLVGLVNTGNGITITNASGNIIGGPDALLANIISGNGVGVAMSGPLATANRVQSNYIGIAIDGASAIANDRGVLIEGGASGNFIGTDGDGSFDASEGNTISGNTGTLGFGVHISDADNNIVAGNRIGVNFVGDPIPNREGVFVNFGSTGNRIGTNADGTSDTLERNIISGNTNRGVRIEGGGTDSNTVAGNYIGTLADGSTVVGNFNGVLVAAGATNSTIGGLSSAARNILSGNSSTGVTITDVGTTNNFVVGNYIGTDVTGSVDLGNGSVGVAINEASGNTVGGLVAGERNVISGQDFGISLAGAAGNNSVIGNFIGLNAIGDAAIPNNVGIQSSAIAVNTIGGTVAGSRNVISGNTSYGIGLVANDHIVEGNWIGLNATGNAAVPNGLAGVIINGNDGNVIGGTAAGAGNVISGNTAGDGVWVTNGGDSNLVQGNLIGTDPTGTIAIPNAIGVNFNAGATNNVIGGSTAGARNIIGGNTLYGVNLSDVGTSNNAVAGNYIGLNATGTTAVANAVGISITAGTNNRIGTDGDGVNDADEGNVISGNAAEGINVLSSNNRISGNYVGTDATGTFSVSNRDAIYVDGSTTGNIIGTDGSNDAFNASERNVISGNLDRGILLSGANVAAGNWIGINVNGDVLANQFGLQVTDIGSRVGTNADGVADTEERNVISGNSIAGLIIRNSDTSGAIIAGNYIGTDPSGTLARPNNRGIEIVFEANNITVGGTTAAARNVISGNTIDGVRVNGANSNTILGNYIGVDATGNAPLPNIASGVYVLDSANVTIGGPTAASRNLISGNSGFGVELNGTVSAGHVVQNNYVGTNASGTVAIPNSQGGVYLLNTGGNALEDNLLSGNLAFGVYVVTSSNNAIRGNIVGLNATGTSALPNVGVGVRIEAWTPAVAEGNTIGGLLASDRNVISGNTGEGIMLRGSGTSGTLVTGNYIGTNVSGTLAIANAVGIAINGESSGNTIGGSTAGARNLISGNTAEGIGIRESANENVVAGNYIGTDVNGTGALGNETGIHIDSGATNALIGGFATTPGSVVGNVISGNTGRGIWDAIGATGTIIRGNLVGLGSDGSTDLGNGSSGVQVNGLNTIIGGDDDDDGLLDGTIASRNVISGNGGVGINIGHSGSVRNTTVQGNYIGTNRTGAASVANATGGVLVGSAPGTRIGGITPGAGNIISGNASAGISIVGISYREIDGLYNSAVEGNWIGLNAAGTAAVPNVIGISISSSISGPLAGGNRIGGTIPEARNIISGNSSHGVTVTGVNAAGNLIAGNYIGTSPDGTLALPNTSSGIQLTAGANNNTIGGSVASFRNLISGNTVFGVDIRDASSNTIEGNYIGTDVTGSLDLGNTSSGINIQAIAGLEASNNTLRGNVISGNNVHGVHFSDSSGVYTGSTLVGNIIGMNAAGTTVLGNSQSGVYLTGADGIAIGGTALADRNIVSGNTQYGIVLDAAANTNTIRGNYIGTDINGSLDRGNGLSGVWVINGSSNNVIGGTLAGAGNVISGNDQAGINIQNPTTIGNLIQGNRIGTNAASTSAIGNTGDAVIIQLGASNNIVGGDDDDDGVLDGVVNARNILSGNAIGARMLAGDGNILRGNYIGTNASGSTGIANTTVGLVIGAGAINTTIGGTTAGAGNVVSGNQSGITVSGAGILNTFFYGNRIGTTADGLSGLGNLSNAGLSIGAAVNTVVGDGTAAGRNIISNNFTRNVAIQNATGIVFQGNFVGTDATGFVALGRPSVWGIDVFGSATGVELRNNLVSGNGNHGIVNGATGTIITGNISGLNLDGSSPLPNNGDGLIVTGANAVIGGTAPSDRNVFSGNSRHGITLTSSGNVVQGNYIGTNLSGTVARPNANTGITMSSAASNNLVGGSTPGAGNVISGNADYGLRFEVGSTNNTVQGNYVGVGSDGVTSLINTNGALNVASGATLKGTGTFTGNVLNQGEIAPGNSPGIITINGNYAQSSAANLEIEIQGTNPNTPDFDQLIVNGTVTLDGTLNILHLGGFIAANGDTFRIIDNDGVDAVNGAFSGLSEGATFVSDGQVYRITYVGGTGNDVVLTAIASFVVTTTADSGSGSLREAVQLANSRTGDDSITFDAALTSGGPATIVLSSQILISDTTGITSITGPGSALLAISGNNATRMFQVDATAGLSLTGLALTAGRMNQSGGAILNFGTLALTRTTFYGNQSLDDAGAVANALGNLTISESTFFGNTTSNDGGAIRNSGTLTIVNSTFSGNTAGIVGGALRLDNPATITNSIFSGNTAGQFGPEIFGFINSGGYNLFQDTGSLGINGSTTGNILGQSALLGSLANNGGNALTLALLGGSPAIGNGDPGQIGTTAQNGVLRSASLVDIGAFQTLFAPLTVTHTGDSGYGSLRNAITFANSQTGADTITFNIAGSGPFAIAPLSGLPSILETLTIDGTSQPGYANQPLIELDGVSAGNAYGLVMNTAAASNSRVQGLAVNRFQLSGILVINGASNVVIDRNHVGVDVTGTLDRGNNAFGVDINKSSGAVITNNLISGNDDYGISLSTDGVQGSVNGATVAGNRIGVNGAGSAAIANLGGVVLSGTTNIVIGGSTALARNLISGNTTNGVFLTGGSVNTSIVGNYIGTDLSGTASIANDIGIELTGFATNNFIGGSAAGARNIISGNTQFGIGLSPIAFGNFVQGNYIGTSADGNSQLANGAGIGLFGSNNLIGTNGDGINDAQERNVISGNATGINALGSRNNKISGNFIGTNA
ncbi:MAG: right-handed parallel beta-helix repeat-containing protein, partial [Pirellula sp.]|nr:right-handed parallel beta-helix repeat-containing protein [Pirellula sp.]